MTNAANTAPTRTFNDASNLSTETIVGWLVDAVQLVAATQSELWSLSQGEETRVGQVFIELRRLVPPSWDVDVEYRRQGGDGAAKRLPGIEAQLGRLVRPDIVVHRRGDLSPAGNLLVAEFKNRDRQFFYWSSADGRKVVTMQDTFHAQVGALVSFGKTDRQCAPKILWRNLDGALGGPINIPVTCPNGRPPR